MQIRPVSFPPSLPEAITAFEQLAGIRLTIHDIQGLHPPRWRDRQMPLRHLHRAPFCWEGRFCHPVWNRNCTQECLTIVHTRLRQDPRPFLKTCWKGGTELVVPIVRDGQVLMILYAGVFRLPGEPGPKLPEPIGKLYRELPEWDEKQGPRLVAALTFFGNALQRELALLTDREEADGSRERAIRRFIQENAHRQPGLRELAKFLFVSESRAGHVAKEVLGMTFHDALQEERLNRAVNLLALAPGTPLAEVAAAVGFRDVCYFSRCFSRRYGMGPRTYVRKQFHFGD